LFTPVPEYEFSLTGLTDLTGIAGVFDETPIPTPRLSPRVIVSDLEMEAGDCKCKKCGKRKAIIPPREPGSPEIISETEPESD